MSSSLSVVVILISGVITVSIVVIILVSVVTIATVGPGSRRSVILYDIISSSYYGVRSLILLGIHGIRSTILFGMHIILYLAGGTGELFMHVVMVVYYSTSISVHVSPCRPVHVSHNVSTKPDLVKAKGHGIPGIGGAPSINNFLAICYFRTSGLLSRGAMQLTSAFIHNTNHRLTEYTMTFMD